MDQTPRGPARLRMPAWLICLLPLAACSDSSSGPGTTPAPVALRLETVATGLSSPVHLSAPASDSRLFIVEQPGRIRLVKGGQLLGTPFLDIRSRVLSGGERGLLSVAFHPDYAQNGFFFVNFTDLNGDTRVERFRVSADADVADPASSRLILTVGQPFSNHNGGHVAFGADDMLYVAMGDGGSGGDPQGNGQNRSTLLGALLRIDVDGGDPYAIPTGNPFIGAAGLREEIWAYGLRNPWRIAFDRAGGVLYIADVGQNRWEEVNAVPAGQAGVNYGWNVMEGTHCYAPSSGCVETGLTLPVVEMEHTDGVCSVTGGLVYRGTGIPEIAGHYFYGDYCAGWIRSFRLENGQARDQREWDLPPVSGLTSFGEDAAGELYVMGSGGTVFRIARAD